MKKILITTTDSLYGWEIETYIKPVFASVVIGANAFADISAAFTDFFGGRSSAYERRLQTIKDNAINILTLKATELGANCILGLTIDMDEISGKGTQMFMITAGGTAVIARNPKLSTHQNNAKEIDKDRIKEKANLVKLAQKFSNSSVKIDLEELKPIAESGLSDFKDWAYAKIKSLENANLDVEQYEAAIKLYTQYFGGIDSKDAIDVLYQGLLKETDSKVIKTIVAIIDKNDLVDYSYIHKLLDGDLKSKKVALSILNSDKPSYNSSDVQELQLVIDHLSNAFPNLSTSSTKKGFLSSAEKEVWICNCGTSNPLDMAYCFGCGNDQYGFNATEPKFNQYIPVLTNKLSALKSLL